MACTSANTSVVSAGSSCGLAPRNTSSADSMRSSISWMSAIERAVAGSSSLLSSRMRMRVSGVRRSCEIAATSSARECTCSLSWRDISLNTWAVSRTSTVPVRSSTSGGASLRASDRPSVRDAACSRRIGADSQRAPNHAARPMIRKRMP